MKTQPSCPRCGDDVHAPGLWSSDWSCDRHGAVLPLHLSGQPTTALLVDTVTHAQVPVFVPWPLPRGWVVTGIAHAGDDRAGTRAVAVAASGPNPLGGAGDLLLVVEEPGIGLGARYAGLPGADPGIDPTTSAPHAKVHADGHPTALWCVDAGAGRAVYVGEASGCWLWAILWPDSAGALLLEDLDLVDLRTVIGEIALLPLGALTPRLVQPAGGPPAAPR